MMDFFPLYVCCPRSSHKAACHRPLGLVLTSPGVDSGFPCRWCCGLVNAGRDKSGAALMMTFKRFWRLCRSHQPEFQALYVLGMCPSFKISSSYNWFLLGPATCNQDSLLSPFLTYPVDGAEGPAWLSSCPGSTCWTLC